MLQISILAFRATTDIIQHGISVNDSLIVVSLYRLSPIICTYRKLWYKHIIYWEILSPMSYIYKKHHSFFYSDNFLHNLFFDPSCSFTGGFESNWNTPRNHNSYEGCLYYGWPSFPSNLIPWWWWRPQWVGLECLWLLLCCQWWACLWWYFEAK